jgi:hypothetical protein
MGWAKFWGNLFWSPWKELKLRTVERFKKGSHQSVWEKSEDIFKKQANEQGDQIGRIPQWEIVYFGRFYKDQTSSPKYFGTFPLSVDYVLTFTKSGWATFWTVFFTNSSGHPTNE